jgi:molybdopterin converting factor small subunit
MTLTIKLFATFRNGRFATAQSSHPPGTTVANIVEQLAIPKDEIGFVLVSGRHADLQHEPAPGDTVAIFPLVGGG